MQGSLDLKTFCNIQQSYLPYILCRYHSNYDFIISIVRKQQFSFLKMWIKHLSQGENKMFNLTKRSMNHFLNFFKVKEDKDETIKQFCQAEYKNDWYAAYMTFKQEGRFPNFIRRTL